MAQPPGQRRTATNDIYTALLIVAAALLFLGTIFIAYKSYELLGSVLPTGAPA